MKDFRQEIIKFHNKLKSNQNFAFSKYADGEWLAMCRIQCASGNGEWFIDDRALQSINLLIESFRFKDPEYYVGVSCPCCQGQAHYDMIRESQQDLDHLTFANLFVNSNYNYFLEHIIPEFEKKDNIILVANRNSDISLLPFKVQEFYGVGYNAWVDDLYLIEALKNKNYENKLILFSCGPLGNILAHKLWENNKNNTCIDIGSTIDRWLNNDIMNKRCYATGVAGFSDKNCIWG